MTVARKFAVMALCASALLVPTVAATPASAAAAGSASILANNPGNGKADPHYRWR
ncbi:hypothetical protein [Streptosporangium sp. H16]|uniref:hypothetical protein n=1 Tax=Streptosporangium sp. H16 TaxID=3444184 RepID=UPI003F7A6CDB